MGLAAILWQGVPVARCKDGATGNFLAGRSRATMFLLLAVRTGPPAIFWHGVPVARCKDGALGNFRRPGERIVFTYWFA